MLEVGLYSPSDNTPAGRGPVTEEFSASGSRWTPLVRAPRWGSEVRGDRLSTCQHLQLIDSAAGAPPLTDITTWTLTKTKRTLTLQIHVVLLIVLLFLFLNGTPASTVWHTGTSSYFNIIHLEL